MKSLALIICAITAALIFAAPSQAALIEFHAGLIGSNVVPPNNSRATGTATLTLDTVSGSLSIAE